MADNKYLHRWMQKLTIWGKCVLGILKVWKIWKKMSKKSAWQGILFIAKEARDIVRVWKLDGAKILIFIWLRAKIFSILEAIIRFQISKFSKKMIMELEQFWDFQKSLIFRTSHYICIHYIHSHFAFYLLISLLRYWI